MQAKPVLTRQVLRTEHGARSTQYPEDANNIPLPIP